MAHRQADSPPKFSNTNPVFRPPTHWIAGPRDHPDPPASMTPDITYQPNSYVHQTPADEDGDRCLGNRDRIPAKKCRQKTERAKYSSSHLEILNYIFNRMRYPTIVHQSVLAARLGIKQHQIKFWFQNRRRKESKHPSVTALTGAVEEAVLAKIYKEMLHGRRRSASSSEFKQDVMETTLSDICRLDSGSLKSVADDTTASRISQNFMQSTNHSQSSYNTSDKSSRCPDQTFGMESLQTNKEEVLVYHTLQVSPAPQRSVLSRDPAPQRSILSRDPAPQRSILSRDLAPQRSILTRDPAPQRPILSRDPANGTLKVSNPISLGGTGASMKSAAVMASTYLQSHELNSDNDELPNEISPSQYMSRLKNEAKTSGQLFKGSYPLGHVNPLSNTPCAFEMYKTPSPLKGAHLLQFASLPSDVNRQQTLVCLPNISDHTDSNTASVQANIKSELSQEFCHRAMLQYNRNGTQLTHLPTETKLTDSKEKMYQLDLPIDYSCHPASTGDNSQTVQQQLEPFSRNEDPLPAMFVHNEFTPSLHFLNGHKFTMLNYTGRSDAESKSTSYKPITGNIRHTTGNNAQESLEERNVFPKIATQHSQIDDNEDVQKSMVSLSDQETLSVQVDDICDDDQSESDSASVSTTEGGCSSEEPPWQTLTPNLSEYSDEEDDGEAFVDLNNAIDLEIGSSDCSSPSGNSVQLERIPLGVNDSGSGCHSVQQDPSVHTYPGCHSVQQDPSVHTYPDGIRSQQFNNNILNDDMLRLRQMLHFQNLPNLDAYQFQALYMNPFIINDSSFCSEG